MSLPAFTSDVAFYIGDTHTICQDYGRCGPNVLAISDGCSSSPDSDFAARYIAMAASRMESPFTYMFAQRVADKALAALAQSGDAGPLPEAYKLSLAQMSQNLDATLLAVGTAPVLQDGNLYNHVIVLAHGDGAIVVDYVDGTREIYRVDYSCNAPFYPSYLLCDVRFAKYVEQCGGIGNVSVNHGGTEWTPFSTLITGEPFKLTLPADTVARVTLMTDGVFSYTSRDGSPVDVFNIINELCAYKSSCGDFVQRRMNKARKTFAKNGLVQNDDLTVGCYNLQAIL